MGEFEAVQDFEHPGNGPQHEVHQRFVRPGTERSRDCRAERRRADDEIALAFSAGQGRDAMTERRHQVVDWVDEDAQGFGTGRCVPGNG